MKAGLQGRRLTKRQNHPGNAPGTSCAPRSVHARLSRSGLEHREASSGCAHEFKLKQLKLRQALHYADSLPTDGSLLSEFPSLMPRVSPASVSDVGALANAPRSDGTTGAREG